MSGYVTIIQSEVYCQYMDDHSQALLLGTNNVLGVEESDSNSENET